MHAGGRTFRLQTCTRKVRPQLACPNLHARGRYVPNLHAPICMHAEGTSPDLRLQTCTRKVRPPVCTMRQRKTPSAGLTGRWFLAPRVGLEPTTTRLTAAGSTIELSRNMCSLASNGFKYRQISRARKTFLSVFCGSRSMRAEKHGCSSGYHTEKQANPTIHRHMGLKESESWYQYGHTGKGIRPDVQK